MKKVLSLTAVLVLFSVANAQTEDCEIPGKTIHWIAGYCMHQAETDDFLDEQVQSCFEKNQGYKTKDTCENKKKYKMKLCQHLVGMGYFDGDTETCFNDKEFIPSTVRHGGI